MNRILSFFCRCILFVLFVIASKMESRIVHLDIMQRVVVSCMQICVLALVWLAYECCLLVISVFSTSHRYEFIHSRMVAAEPEDAVTFENKSLLKKYIREVHVVGIVLWSTMLCSDYALDQTSFTFLLGMLIGNVMSVCSSAYGGNQPLKGKLTIFSVYWALVLTLVIIYLVHDGQHVIEYTEEQLGLTVVKHMDWTAVVQVVNVLFAPLSSGITWTYWMDPGTLLDHYQTSVYSCVLLSIPVMMSMDTEFYTHLFVQYDTITTVHLFTTEPLLKFMTIYVLALSLELESVLDMLVSNAVVSGVLYAIMGQHTDLFNASVGLLVTILLIFHSIRLTMLTLQDKRDKHKACFVILEEQDQEPEKKTDASTLTEIELLCESSVLVENHLTGR